MEHAQYRPVRRAVRDGVQTGAAVSIYHLYQHLHDAKDNLIETGIEHRYKEEERLREQEDKVQKIK